MLRSYKGVQYHLKKYSRNPSRNSHKLFNFRHKSSQNAIERAFVVLEKKICKFFYKLHYFFMDLYVLIDFLFETYYKYRVIV